MTMSTDTDIQEYFPDLYEFGIQDFSTDHARTREDIIRQLRIDWWPRMQSRTNIFSASTELNVALLTETQFTRAAVFHVLSYYILPKLAKFDPEGDKFENMMKYYKERYSEEFNLILKDGVEYDTDDSGNISNDEKIQNVYDRLVR